MWRGIELVEHESLATDDIGLILFPWNSSLQTGRGHDIYSYHLLKHLSSLKLKTRIFPIDTVKNLQQGVNRLDYIMKEALFLKRMVNWKTGIYHGISPLGAKTAILAKKKPVVTTIHDAIPFIHQRDIRQAYERLCIRLCCKRSNQIIVSSSFTQCFLRKTIGLDLSKVSVIRYGVDRQVFSYHKNKSKSGLNVFSILRWSDVERLFYVFKQVRERVPDVSFSLGLANSFQKEFLVEIPFLLRKYNLSNSVKILRNVSRSELSGYYNSADVYLSASVGGFSLTLLEAMACGTPVIAFNLMDIPEYVGTDGVLVQPNDFKGLANETVKLLLDEDLRNDLGKRSIERSLDFSWRVMAEKTVGVYKKAS